MRIHEFGTEHEKTVLLLHSACLSWRMFRPAVERPQTQYHLIIPALPAHDPDEKTPYTSVEAIAAELGGWLTQRGIGAHVCARCGHHAVPCAAVADAGLFPAQLSRHSLCAAAPGADPSGVPVAALRSGGGGGRLHDVGADGPARCLARVCFLLPLPAAEAALHGGARVVLVRRKGIFPARAGHPPCAPPAAGDGVRRVSGLRARGVCRRAAGGFCRAAGRDARAGLDPYL